MTETASAEQVRQEMTDRLLAEGRIRSPFVEKAFRTVPREKFTPPGTSLADAYPGDKAVITKRDLDGRNISSISAPWLQAAMCEQAGLQPGMKVLEVGSGGVNAAIMAEVVGPAGHVVSMDIDAEITANAVAALTATGYADRVTVVTGDAATETSGHGPYDAIIVTVGMWDIPPVLLKQLNRGAPIVIPLRMNGVTRSLGLWPRGDHWQSQSMEVCGFVPVQGALAREPALLYLEHPGGGRVELSFEDRLPPALLDSGGILTTEPVSVWTGITIPGMTSFADFHLWLAGHPDFCRVSPTDDIDLAGGNAKKRDQRRFSFGLLLGDSLAYLGHRKIGDNEWEFGAWAYGPTATAAAREFASQIAGWDAAGRSLPPDAFSYYPSGSDLSGLPETAMTFRKAFGTAVITWPEGSGRALA